MSSVLITVYADSFVLCVDLKGRLGHFEETSKRKKIDPTLFLQATPHFVITPGEWVRNREGLEERSEARYPYATSSCPVHDDNEC